MSVSAIKALRDLIIRICDIRIEYNVKNSNKKIPTLRDVNIYFRWMRQKNPDSSRICFQIIFSHILDIHQMQ